MQTVSDRMQGLIEQLGSDERRRIEQRSEAAAGDSARQDAHAAADDGVIDALRQVQTLVNGVREERGEEPVDIVDAARELDDGDRARAQRTIVEHELDPVAAVATVGVLLYQGRKDEAQRVLESVADRDAMAAQTLGLLLEDRGDELGAMRFQQSAAERGDRMAMYNLGRLLHERGDDRKALKWLCKSDDPRAVQLAREIEA
jgi:TPR repeat protein